MDKDKIELRLQRDDSGELRSVDGLSPTLSMPVTVIPMTYGQSRSYKSFGDNVYMWSDEDKMDVINKHVVFPEIKLIDVADMHDNFDPFTIEDLVASVFVYSGMARLFITEGNEVAGETDKIISA